MNAQTDILTGLLSVSALMESIEAATHGSGSFVLVVMDMDHFKAFNDQYGHMAGDALIEATAKRFQQTFHGEGAVIGRYGGDEFMALVPAADLNSRVQQAEDLRRAIEVDGPTITVNGQEIQPKFTVSLGLAALPYHATETADLVEKAKRAMYRAKIAGGNQAMVYQDTDLLTGLMHRSAIEQTLEDTLATARQEGETVSLFVLDIDRFKEINDEYGHRAGDEVLKRLGHILQANFTGMGITGRMGGDEFVVILPGQRADSAFILAEEVRRLVDDSELDVQVGAHHYTLRFRISGGIAAFPSDAANSIELLRKADEALYRSKQIGRNRISLPANAQMVTKTSYYTQTQLQRLGELAHKMDKTEAFLLREALDDLFQKYRDDGGS